MVDVVTVFDTILPADIPESHPEDGWDDQSSSRLNPDGENLLKMIKQHHFGKIT